VPPCRTGDHMHDKTERERDNTTQHRAQRRHYSRLTALFLAGTSGHIQDTRAPPYVMGATCAPNPWFWVSQSKCNAPIKKCAADGHTCRMKCRRSRLSETLLDHRKIWCCAALRDGKKHMLNTPRLNELSVRDTQWSSHTQQQLGKPAVSMAACSTLHSPHLHAVP